MARFKAFTSDDEDDGASSSSSSSSSTHSPRKLLLQTTTTPAANPVSRALSPASSVTSSSLSSESIEHDAGREDEDSIMDENELNPVVNGEENKSGDERLWVEQLDLEPHRVHVMQTSLFRVPELAKTQLNDTPNFLKHQRSQDTYPALKKVPPLVSFAEPRLQPPPRKYLRVSASASISAGQENIYIDAGLAFGRSFRVGWGPRDKLAHVGELGQTKSANSSIASITSPQRSSLETPDILQYLLSNTPIEPPSPAGNGTPHVIPNRDITFSSFLPTILAQEKSHFSSVFSLGHALFDPLDLHLDKSTPTDIRHRVLALQRADALSTWVAQTVAPSVGSDLDANSSNFAKDAFLYLSGNQIAKAVGVLTNGGGVRLATLISQVPGDAEFRSAISDQLRIWKEEKVDLHISEDVRKLYALAAGEVNFLEGSGRREDINMVKGLDWLRVFGMLLWFSSPLDTPLHESFERYEELFKSTSGRVPAPTPWYLKPGQRVSPAIHDGLFNLIKLALSPSMTLESALDPLGFTPNPTDYKLSWFIYIILSRCLRLRDFTDRQLHDAMLDDSDSGQSVDGFSATANNLTMNFALQLQQEGLVQEAAFVLLFLEDDIGRKRALKELLARSAPVLDEWMVAGLCGSLKIPQEWIDEAKATHALYNNQLYDAYELFTRAKVHQRAHELAITYLAPEAILRDDLDLLYNLFSVLDESLVDGFGVGGQLFIDYTQIITRLPELRERQKAEDAVPDASEVLELERLLGRIPKLMGILPDVLRDKPETGIKHKAALSHMLSRLLVLLDEKQTMTIEIQPGTVDAAASIKHVHATAFSDFIDSCLAHGAV